MDKSWLLKWLSNLVGGQPTPPASPSLSNLLDQYQQALDKASQDIEALLPTLLIRDQVELALKETKKLTALEIRQLLELDGRLRNQTSDSPLTEFVAWRQSLHPPESSWWWYLDAAFDKREKEKDLLWELLALTFTLLTLPLLTDIIK